MYSTKVLGIALLGCGKVAQEFVRLLAVREAALRERRVEFRIVGISRLSGSCAYSTPRNLDGFSFTDTPLHSMADDEWISKIRAAATSGARPACDQLVLVDGSTATNAGIYRTALDWGLDLETANKRLLVGPQAEYDDFRRRARQLKRHFGSRVCVSPNGFHLPMFERHLVGDAVHSIEAVLGGSPAFFFSELDSGKRSPGDVVQEAQTREFTDPGAVDWLGIDVQWKILLLLRALGFKRELQDIDVESIFSDLPTGPCSNEEVVEHVRRHEGALVSRLRDAHARGRRLRYLSTIDADRGTGKARIEECDATHPAYHLSGRANVLCCHSENYQDSPLVLQGPGAGCSAVADGLILSLMHLGTAVDRGS